MSTFSVGGLASGLDTKSIVDQLMAIEGRTKTTLDWKSQLWSARKTAWSDLNSKLLTLQNAANALLRPETWVPPVATPGTFTATSGDPSRLTATAGASATAGSYAVDVLQLARAEISRSSGTLSPATSGIRATGAFYEGNANVVEGNEAITALRQANGTNNVGLNTNSRITMNYTVNGVAQSAEFLVNTVGNGGDGTTLANLSTWVASTIGNGASAAWVGGQLRVTTAPGTNAELDAMSFTAVNAAGTNLPNFNSLAGAGSSTFTAASDGGVTVADTLTIAGNGGSWNVGLSIGDQKADIVAKINATSGIGVTASLVSGEIELRSTTTGAASAFTVTSPNGTAASLGFTETQAAQDAQYTVNGTTYTSAVNNGAAGAIPDVTLNLLATTSTTLTVGAGTPGSSTEDKFVAATKAKIQDFVTAYNATLDYVHQRTQGESRVASPKNLGEYLQGPMSRDVGFSGVAFDLRRLTGDVVSGLPSGESMLSDFGIKTSFSLGGGGNNGKLTIDDAALDAALRADPTKVQAVLGNIGAGAGIAADDGIVRRISEQVSLLRVGGRVDSSMNGAGNEVKRIQDSMDRMTQRLEKKRQYYDRMFASLETTLGKMQSQGQWLSGQLAGLSGGQSQ